MDNTKNKKYIYRIFTGCIVSILLFMCAVWVELQSRKPHEPTKCIPAGGVLCENLFDFSTGSPLITRWAASWMVPTIGIMSASVFGYTVYWAAKHKELLLSDEGKEIQPEQPEPEQSEE